MSPPNRHGWAPNVGPGMAQGHQRRFRGWAVRPPNPQVASPIERATQGGRLSPGLPPRRWVGVGRVEPPAPHLRGKTQPTHPHHLRARLSSPTPYQAATNCEYYTLDHETFEYAVRKHPQFAPRPPHFSPSSIPFPHKYLRPTDFCSTSQTDKYGIQPP